MNRHLSAMLCGAFFLVLLTLTACDQKPPVVEVPGTDAEKQAPQNVSPQLNGSRPKGDTPVDPFVSANIMDELEKLTQLPEDRSLESLVRFLTTGDEKLMLLAPLFERIPPEKQRQLELNRMKSQSEAADLILKNDAATPAQIRLATNAKGMALGMSLSMDKAQDAAALDAFSAEIEAYRRAGKPRIAWEMEQVLLLVDTLRQRDSIDSQEALIAAREQHATLLRRALELLENGKDSGFLSAESLDGMTMTILQLNNMLPATEESVQDLKTLREVLAAVEPNDELTKSDLQNCLVQVDIRMLMTDFGRAFQSDDQQAEPEPEAFDALVAGVIETFKKAAAEKVSLVPMNVFTVLQMADGLETRASRASVDALYDTLQAALEADESENKTTMIERVQAAKRRFNLPGSEMEFQAIKPDLTPVSLKDFAGKVVLLDMLSLQHQQAFSGQYKFTQQLQNLYKGTDLEIVWYLAGARPEEIGQMAEMMGMTWNVTVPVPEGAGPAAPLDYYEIFQLPRMFLIGRDGKVISSNIYGDDLLIELHRLFPDVELPEVAAARVEATELEMLGENLEPVEPAEPEETPAE